MDQETMRLFIRQLLSADPRGAELPPILQEMIRAECIGRVIGLVVAILVMSGGLYLLDRVSWDDDSNLPSAMNLVSHFFAVFICIAGAFYFGHELTILAQAAFTPEAFSLNYLAALSN